MIPLRIPFNRVVPFGRENEYMRLALERGHVSGNGPFTRACEQWLERELGAPRVLLTTSCTHALEMAAMLLDLAPDDEVIMPSFTFVSTANAVALRRAKPVFVDIRDDSLNIDERLTAAAVGPRTRAIIPVHYAGVACQMDSIRELAAARGFSVVEDNAHGLFGTFHDRPLGTLGRLAALSFHETKNISCGEGGALVVNDPALVARAEILREKGTDRARFLRGETDKYTWMDIGSSYIISDLLAGFLLGQLEASQRIQENRRGVFARYAGALQPWISRHGVRTLAASPGSVHPFHMFYLRLPTRAERDAFVAHLRARGILAVSHYVPLHLSPMGRAYGYKTGDLPVTEAVSEQIVRLPFFPALSEREQESVIEAILEIDVRVLPQAAHG